MIACFNATASRWHIHLHVRTNADNGEEIGDATRCQRWYRRDGERHRHAIRVLLLPYVTHFIYEAWVSLSAEYITWCIALWFSSVDFTKVSSHHIAGQAIEATSLDLYNKAPLSLTIQRDASPIRKRRMVYKSKNSQTPIARSMRPKWPAQSSPSCYNRNANRKRREYLGSAICKSLELPCQTDADQRLMQYCSGWPRYRTLVDSVLVAHSDFARSAERRHQTDGQTDGAFRVNITYDVSYSQLLDPDYGTVFHRTWKRRTYHTIIIIIIIQSFL